MAHIKQVLTMAISEDVMDAMHYSSEDVTSAHGHLGGAVEVYGDELSVLLGVLVFFPAVSLKGLQGK